MSLSDKIILVDYESQSLKEHGVSAIKTRDVREAVKELKDRNDTCGCPCCNSWAKDIDEIFGSRLTQ